MTTSEEEGIEDLKRKLYESLRPKPWEGTWRESPGAYVVDLHGVVVADFAPRQIGDPVPAEPSEIACAKLAAQAPPMARLLLEIREQENAKTTEDFVYCMHEKMDRIEAILRAAGVLP